MKHSVSHVWATPGSPTATIAVGDPLRKTINHLLEAYERCLENHDLAAFNQGASGSIQQLVKGAEFLHQLSYSSIRMHVAHVEEAHNALQLFHCLLYDDQLDLDTPGLQDLLLFLLDIDQIKLLDELLIEPLDFKTNSKVKIIFKRFISSQKSGQSTFLTGWEALAFHSFLSKRTGNLPPSWKILCLQLRRQTLLARACFMRLHGVNSIFNEV